MKVRSDFVSNSSSCSFLVYLQSAKDVQEFKKIYGNILKTIPARGSVTAYTQGQRCGENFPEEEFDKNIKKGTWVEFDIGEDNEYYSTDKLDDDWSDLTSCIRSSIYKFKVYQDPYAHMTIGNPMPPELEEEYWNSVRAW